MDQSNIPKKSNHAEREERILAFWKEKRIFEKSLETPAGQSPKGDYTFYDGPPFANGLPHYGHILAGTIKDVIPRFKTMQGFRVRRRWGWDCHGLPVENIVEKELGFMSKKDIVDYGLHNFNAKARESVMRYADEWRRTIPRLGRWVDMDHDYRTMDASYTESVWWIFKQLYEKGLIYEGFKSMNLCPHCGTTLSNFEVVQGYRDITDISVFVKFRLLNTKFKHSNSNTYIIAWTTTPWTLPGNTALAVGEDIEYVIIQDNQSQKLVVEPPVSVENSLPKSESQMVNFIIAKKRYLEIKDDLIKKKILNNPQVVETIKGSELVGLSYVPIFDYYSKDSTLKNRENGWKIYGADFVTIEDGTGVVHIAPAFGADDYTQSQKHKLPFIQHVAGDGTFKDDFARTSEGQTFAGMQVKPKDTEDDKNFHQKTDIEIIKWLAHNGFLFDKEKLIHSYPHCWRCETPLLNYASSSWFVKVTDIKDKLVSENKKITWIPPEVGSARFGNWLEGARDWAISRSRFWGAAIPVWKEKSDVSPKSGIISNSKHHVIGSLEDLKKFSKARNTYSVMRHGEAENNVLGILSGIADAQHHLTEKGKKQVDLAAEKLKGQKFDLVFISPFLRTRETADILKSKLGWKNDQMIYDNRLSELGTGDWNGKKLDDFIAAFKGKDRFDVGPVGGETYKDIKRRMGNFLYDLEKTYEGKNILLITHETPILLLLGAAHGLRREEINKIRSAHYDFMINAEVRELDFTPLPHNEDFELDLHRPYIDNIELKTSDGKKLERVSDVFDCWFESGSMPFAEHHYPFGNDGFEPKSGLFHKSVGYPADFIAEGLDQTRGWFYSMLVLGVALFGKTPYKKVIVNGLVLAEDGQKMSKSKQNYPNPILLVDKYGADSLRYYMLSSPVVHGQDLRFSEKGVDEITKKLVNRLLNVVSFYETYKAESQVAKSQTIDQKIKVDTSRNILDLWIISRLNETISIVTKGLEDGELDRASRPLMDLVDDLSTWYLRRSRDRFKVSADNENNNASQVDKNFALETTKFVLLEMAKLFAPFMPFLADEIWHKINDSNTLSVHLASWPQSGVADTKILDVMKLARDLSSMGLEARMTAKINVRQPLSSLQVKVLKDEDKSQKIGHEFIELIKDEVNVKEVLFSSQIANDVELDLDISPGLRREGMVRELIRAIQDLRKAKGLRVDDKAELVVETDDSGKQLIESNRSELTTICTISKIIFDKVQAEPTLIGDISFKLSL